jgi:hypothetical protein
MLNRLGLESDVRFQHDSFEFSDRAKPPHDFSIEARLARYAHVDRLVYMERDPRDVMVSLYHQVIGRRQIVFNYRGDISAFLRDEYFGAHNLARFRAMWARIVEELGFLTVTYEDCHIDMRGQMTRVLAYYGFEVEEKGLTAAVSEAAFDRMKEVEQSGSFPELWLRPILGSPKVRQGRVGGFAEVLSAEDIAYLDHVFAAR